MSKKIRVLMTVFLGAVLLEVLVFNFQPIKDRVLNNLYINQRYDLMDFVQYNWVASEQAMVSELDPMLVLPDLNCYVNDIKVQYGVQGALGYIDLFYTDDEHPIFDSDALIRTMTEKTKDTLTISMGKAVQTLRIDMGDAPGLLLEEFVVVINPSILDISAARIIAVLLIFYTAKLLFIFQKSPDYSCYFYNIKKEDGEES